MKSKPINPTGNSYSQALLIENASQLLFISGQIPVDKNEKTPAGFREQCILTWKNIELQLHAAGMKLENIVKVTVFLSDRKYREENMKIRKEILKEHQPALTIIITGIYDEAWLLEIEAIAAK